jgi:hypothetical protein
LTFACCKGISARGALVGDSVFAPSCFAALLAILIRLSRSLDCQQAQVTHDFAQYSRNLRI